MTSLLEMTIFLIKHNSFFLGSPALGTYITNIFAKNTYTRAISDKSTCNSQNLEVKSTRLEIWIKASYINIENICIGQNLEIKGAGLEIWVEVGWYL